MEAPEVFDRSRDCAVARHAAHLAPTQGFRSLRIGSRIFLASSAHRLGFLRLVLVQFIRKSASVHEQLVSIDKLTAHLAVLETASIFNMLGLSDMQ